MAQRFFMYKEKADFDASLGYRLRIKFLRKINNEIPTCDDPNKGINSNKNETCQEIAEAIKIGNFSKVHTTVLLNDNPNSWDIPDDTSTSDPNDFGCEIEHELCLTEKYNGTIDLSVLMNTENEESLNLEVEVKSVEDFTKNINEEFTVNVNIGSSYVYKVNLTGINGSLLVNVSSPNVESCGMVSIHPLICPINPVLTNIQSGNKIPRQTMYNMGAFTINATDYKDKENGDGFFIKFTAHPKDIDCNKTSNVKTKRSIDKFKTFSCKITKHPTIADTLWVDILLTCLYLLSIIAMFIVTFMISRQGQTNVKNKIAALENVDNQDQFHPPKYLNQLCKVKNTRRTIFIQDDLYVWMVTIICVCYCIPASQLVFKHELRMLTTGDNDICYFNFLCTIPIDSFFGKYFLDYNHVFSNIGYSIFGLAFMIIVKFQSNKNRNSNSKLGIPQYFGIYYAMGLSLMAEGCLSSFYHVCPNEENFQFDTTFIYVISVLMIVKIYQFRHPDVSSGAYKVFLLLSFVLLIEVIDFDGLWVFLTIMYLYVMIQLSPILYNSGKWGSPSQNLKNLKYIWSKGWSSVININNKTNLIFVILFNIINLVFIIFGNIKQPNLSLSDFFLFVFMGNLMLYFGYYFTMKFFHKEHITPAAYIFLCFVIVSGPIAMYLFNSKAKTTRVSPAESRNLNQNCIIGMYDTHDLWHLLSAEAIFSFFMLLLVIDDGIADKPRNKIRIF